jgi:hypothetical protein
MKEEMNDQTLQVAYSSQEYLKGTHPCRCQVSDSLAWVGWRLKSVIDYQRKNVVRFFPDQHGKVVDYRTTPYYQHLSRVLESAEIAFQYPNGVVCPYLVLLRAVAEGWPGGECSNETRLQLVDVLKHIGAVEGDPLPKIAQLALDRLQGHIAGGFVSDWMES